MSYQVIARKYRPQHFEDVVGQEHVTRTLANAIEQQRIAHAYLFCGPRGTGKTTIARIFAKCLNCTDGPSVGFSDDDPRCQEIAAGNSLDVLEIDGASNNGVEQVRELRETCRFAPANSAFKIYIIDEVHMLSTAAFNALLKTLEEPPAHVKFMFATTDPERVLPTILSRCQRFDLRRIPSKLIVEHLQEIAGKEGIEIDPAALDAVARGADGGMRDAESTLDQLISFCGRKIEEADVLSMFGLTARSQIGELAGAILEGEIEGSLRLLDDLARNGKDLGRLLSDLLSHFRNLLIHSVSGGDRNLLEVPESEAEILGQQSGAVDAEALARIMEVLTTCEGRLRDATSKKILIEVSLIKAIQARNAVSIDAVLQTLRKLQSGEGGTPGAGGTGSTAAKAGFKSLKQSLGGEKASAKTAPAPAATKPAPAAKSKPAPPQPEPASAKVDDTPAPAPAKSKPAPAPAPAPAQTSGDTLESLWQQLLEAVGRASPFTRTYLIEAHPVSLEKNTLTIGFDPEFADHRGMVDNGRNHQLLQNKLKELGHPHLQVKVIEADTPPGRPRPAPAPAPKAAQEPAVPKQQAEPSKEDAEAARPAAPTEPPPPVDMEDFKNDPLIKKALEVFKGHIVDVRT